MAPYFPSVLQYFLFYISKIRLCMSLLQGCLLCSLISFLLFSVFICRIFSYISPIWERRNCSPVWPHSHPVSVSYVLGLQIHDIKLSFHKFFKLSILLHKVSNIYKGKENVTLILVTNLFSVIRYW